MEFGLEGHYNTAAIIHSWGKELHGMLHMPAVRKFLFGKRKYL
jgi:hypothetical protein